MIVLSRDGTEIYYETTGAGDTAFVFVHGWMGNVRWWDAQRDAFEGSHLVVALDLAGHGRSGRTRTSWSVDAYAGDIVAVARAVAAKRIVLVGHSMSGVHALAAAPDIEALAALVLVDTVKDIDHLPTAEQAAPMFARYRADYAGALATVLPGMLFAPGTPPAVSERLLREFGAVSGDVATTLLEPLYAYDVRMAARRTRVPIRGIATDLHPFQPDANRAYFADYDITVIPGYGHYPMLEAPDAFNTALRGVLGGLGL